MKFALFRIVVLRHWLNQGGGTHICCVLCGQIKSQGQLEILFVVNGRATILLAKVFICGDNLRVYTTYMRGGH